MKLLLDTHVWYWFVIGDKTLTKKSIDLINQAALSDSLYLSSISVWEIALMESKGRISFQVPTLKWVEEALKNIPIQLIFLYPSIAVESCHLIDFHGDPADRIIAATARVENLTLLTRDKKIQAYSKMNKVNIISV